MSSSSPLLISTGHLTRETLKEQVAIVTGAGRGIGFEAARALAWLGARVIIAEIDSQTGADAAARINSELGAGSALFVQTDVGDELCVADLAEEAKSEYGRVDIVLNDATVTPMGAVQNVSIEKWDESYRVNLRGPVLLARAFLPGMIARNCGVFACVSSVGSAYMGAYEAFKAAQVHLANTLDAELEGTGVCAFTVGPGMVPTPGLEAGLKDLAPLLGKSIPELYAMNESHVISPETAGAGFAAAIALADKFRGQEIDSLAALGAAGIVVPGTQEDIGGNGPSPDKMREALELSRRVKKTLAEQSDGWKKRSLFEKQWVIRDFRNKAGMPVEEWLKTLDRLEAALATGDGVQVAAVGAPLEKLAGYYRHTQDLARGYLQRDPKKMKEQIEIVGGWVEEVDQLRAIIGG